MFSKLKKLFKRPESFICPKCKEGEMFFTGGRYKDYPQSYEHMCSKCGYKSGAGVYHSRNYRNKGLRRI